MINNLSLKLGIAESERESQKTTKSQQEQKLRQENNRLLKDIWALRESIKNKE